MWQIQRYTRHPAVAEPGLKLRDDWQVIVGACQCNWHMTSNRDCYYPRICGIRASQRRDTSHGAVLLEPPGVANILRHEIRISPCSSGQKLLREFGLLAEYPKYRP